MYVCVCNAVTDSDIRNAVDEGVRNMKQLKRTTGCGSACGCCQDMATDLLQQALGEKWEIPKLLPVLQMA